MKTTLLKKKSLYLLTMACTIVVLYNSCAFTKSMFSAGRKSYSLAQEAANKQHYRIAVKHAADAVFTDIKIPRFQKFIFTNFPLAESSTNTFLASSKNTKEISQAEERYKVYNELVDMYNSLSKLEFPLVDKKKDEWKFTTEIKDYSKDVESSRIYAYKLIVKTAKQELLSANLKEAYDKFKKAYNKYTTVENKDTSVKEITASLLKYCKKYEKGTDIPKLESVHLVYGYILYFDPSMQLAIVAKQNIINKISDLYYKQGLKLFAKRAIASKVKSVDSFNLAIKWNPSNTDATNKLIEVKEVLASHYYKSAMALRSNKDKQKAIAKFREAQKWVADYKDSMYQIYSLKVNGELKILKSNLAKTKSEFNQLTKLIYPMSAAVDKSNDALNTLTYVSNNCRDMKGKLVGVRGTLDALAVIPIVGAVFTITNIGVKKVQLPLGKLVHKMDNLERPVITPTKNAISKIKQVTDKVKGTVESTKAVISKTESLVVNIDKCIQNLKIEKDFQKVEGAVKEMNKAVAGVAVELRRINGGFRKCKSGVAVVAKIHSPMMKVKNGINKVKPVLNKINSVTSKINGALSKTVKVPLLGKKSVKDALKAAKPLKILAEKILNPILKKAKIPVPQIPGVNELSGKIDGIKNSFATIKAEADKLKSSYDKYTNYSSIINKNLQRVVATTGCGDQINGVTGEQKQSTNSSTNSNNQKY